MVEDQCCVAACWHAGPCMSSVSYHYATMPLCVSTMSRRWADEPALGRKEDAPGRGADYSRAIGHTLGSSDI